jgi:hypothetical protein
MSLAKWKGVSYNNGVSRDHKISISEAFDKGYNTYYISHPINCELMQQKNNSKKYTKSSITYDELVKLVEEYDNKRGMAQ